MMVFFFERGLHVCGEIFDIKFFLYVDRYISNIFFLVKNRFSLIQRNQNNKKKTDFFYSFFLFGFSGTPHLFDIHTWCRFQHSMIDLDLKSIETKRKKSTIK